MASGIALSEQLKAEGNGAYKAEDWQMAIAKYTEALSALKSRQSPSPERAILLSNRAACWLKLKHWQRAIEDCTDALEKEHIQPSEKVFFRRAQALEGCGDIADAFKDYTHVIRQNPRNAQAIQAARKLKDQLLKEKSGVAECLKRISRLAEGKSVGEDKEGKKLLRELCGKLAEDSSLKREVVEHNGIQVLWKLRSDYCEVFDALALVAEKQELLPVVTQEIDFLDLASSLRSETRGDIAKAVAAFASRLMRLIFPDAMKKENTVKSTGPNATAKENLAKVAIDDNSLMYITKIFISGIRHPDEDVCAIALEGIIIGSTVPHVASMFSEVGGLQAIYDCCASPKRKIQARVAVALGNILSTFTDEQVKEIVQQLALTKLAAGDLTSALQAIGLVTALYLANREVGKWAIAQPGVLRCVEILSLSSDAGSEAVAVELLSHAVDTEEGRRLVQQLVMNVLPRLVNSPDIYVMSGAIATTIKLMIGSKAYRADSSDGEQILEATMRLVRKAGDVDTLETFSGRSLTERAIEAFSYMITDTLTKDKLAKSPALKHLIKLSNDYWDKSPTVAYGIGYIFKHLMVSEGDLKKRQMQGMDVTPQQYEEMMKLTKQQNVFDDGDSEEKVKDRTMKFVSAGGIPVLLDLLKSESPKTSSVAVSAILHAVTEPSVRGNFVQQGALKALAPFTIPPGDESATKRKAQGEDSSQAEAGQAIAKMLITTNPHLLPSSEQLNAVGPLMRMLDEESNLIQFEALMALTNLGSVGADTKRRILSNKGLKKLEYMQFSDNLLVRRAATEAMCNLLPCQEVFDHLKLDDKMRLWIALALNYDEDVETSRAAAGTIATVIDDSECQTCFLKHKGIEALVTLCKAEDVALQHRAIVGFHVLASSNEETVQTLIRSGAVPCILALQKSPVSEVRTAAEDTLQLLQQQSARRQPADP